MCKVCRLLKTTVVLLCEELRRPITSEARPKEDPDNPEENSGDEDDDLQSVLSDRGK
jgi:hypothetical protein